MNKKKKTLFYPNFVWEQNYYRKLGSALHGFGVKSEQSGWYFLLVALYYCKISKIYTLNRGSCDGDIPEKCGGKAWRKGQTCWDKCDKQLVARKLRY